MYKTTTSRKIKETKEKSNRLPNTPRLFYENVHWDDSAQWVILNQKGICLIQQKYTFEQNNYLYIYLKYGWPSAVVRTSNCKIEVSQVRVPPAEETFLITVFESRVQIPPDSEKFS